mmetsp:Transcript_23083/g.32974  ORF Transcript_23083/g.32974 Transcript_23083/m.32974 type:complete len:87 (-) Transcript_23083:778-1038(-)
MLLLPYCTTTTITITTMPGCPQQHHNKLNSKLHRANNHFSAHRTSSFIMDDNALRGVCFARVSGSEVEHRLLSITLVKLLVICSST